MGIRQNNYIRIATTSNSHGSIKTGQGQFIEDFSEFIEKRSQIAFTSELDGGGGLGLHVGIADDADPAANYGTAHRVDVGHTGRVATIRVLSNVVRVLLEGNNGTFVSGDQDIRLEVAGTTLILTKTSGDRYEATQVGTTISDAFADGSVVTCQLSGVVFA